jgi:hypothetical protein
MKFTTSQVAGTVEILAADDFIGIPIKVAGTGVMKAGTPLTAAGAKIANGTGAAGILLYDVDTDANPNGTIVVQGVINQKKAEEHAGVTYDADALKTAVPGIVLRNNIGVNA